MKLNASDLTFLGCASGDETERYVYAIPDELGEMLASPDQLSCDGFYALGFVRKQERGALLSVRLYVEDLSHPMETVLVEGVDYDRKNLDESERAAYDVAVRIGGI